MKRDKKIKKVIIILSIASALLTVIESGIFYAKYLNIEQWPFFITLILENCVHTFTNDANITIKDAVEVLETTPGIFQTVICVLYCLAILVAPICTLAFVYRVFQALFKWRLKLFRPKNKENIIIFGYNDNVRALLKKEFNSENRGKRSICVISNEELSESDEKLFWACKVAHYQFDCFDTLEDELLGFLKGIGLDETRRVILYEESSSKNFSLYHTLFKHGFLNENIGVYCNCEDDEIHDIMENYYNKFEIKPDLEIFSINELRVRKVFVEHPIHEIYLESTKAPQEWHVHMLIVGFGKLGQNMLLQAMSQGVVHSGNDLVFDVVDCNIEEQMQIFANHFSSQYFGMNDNEWIIPNRLDTGGKQAYADGKFVIRFHNMDTRYKNFQNMLIDIYKDYSPTYAAVCITDEKNSMHCMLELEKYLHRNHIFNIPIGVRMEFDERMGKFLTESYISTNKVFIIEDVKNAISLEDMISEQVNRDAKHFHYVYSQLSIEMQKESEEKPALMDTEEYFSTTKDVKKEEEAWKSIKLYKRDSSRASSCHVSILEELVNRQSVSHKEMWEKYFGRNGILRRRGDKWVYDCTEKELVDQINGDAFLKEMAMMEHRRWNYFMASIGWRAKYSISAEAAEVNSEVYTKEELIEITETTDGCDKTIFKKNEEQKINPCMVDWEELCTTPILRSYCKYDLQPLLFFLNKRRENNFN